jgi:hypothetical protein
MRFVLLEDNGVLTLNFMWLPTWIGMNASLKKEIEKALSEKFVGRPSTDLDAMHEEVIDFLVTKFPHAGLRDYLDGIKFVQEG